MNAILAVRPDGATGRPPSLPDGGGVPAAYLEDLIAGQPSGYLARASLPAAGDLAAFVHTGGTTGAPKVAAQTHAQPAGLRPGDRRDPAWHPGRRCWASCRCSTSTP